MEPLPNHIDRSKLLMLLHRDEAEFQRAISDGKKFSEIKPLYVHMKIIHEHLRNWRDSASWVDADDTD